ncbi:MAG: hypothetical protein MH252_15475 [Thermosynechococcaceae cyanobacterium MS004]|nr:hypothetical protein [Thermosynechococcaceae cyanobacterium MS004]
MTSVTIRMPEDVVEDLKRVAPLLGFLGYQPLIRAYIGQCLRVNLVRFEIKTVTALVASLKRRGGSDTVIDEALREVVHTGLANCLRSQVIEPWTFSALLLRVA